MQPQPDQGVVLTAFDPKTAMAVMTVLSRAGITTWAGHADDDEIEVRVPAADRDRAMRALHTRMEEVREAMAETDRRARPAAAQTTSTPLPDPDDVHAGPPLVMERFRSMRFLAAVVLAPLLVVTLAPTLRGGTARQLALLLGAVVLVALVINRRRR